MFEVISRVDAVEYGIWRENDNTGCIKGIWGGHG